ncbi:MAG: hypothetical protein AUK34_13080 [Ignavibacteria bacterium CG2_30_36_16]|nr:hypothetical protein [Ignavibacteria bacterium]OIP55459.1 MAG: hypothetical protein AUK34_13080 [Ignavibacteria bacterium CG2_30_36_16]PJB01294.1 MAG: hypothetical protein CO127_04620 [Ignavibacteria bacterium CG_4_9_14_3_um_filter_36_18]
MKLENYFFIIIFSISFSVNAQKVNSSFTKIDERLKFDYKLKKQIVEENLSFTLNKENEEKWLEAFWGARFGLLKNDLVRSSITSALMYFENASLEFQRSLLETIYTLYPLELEAEIMQIAKETVNPKIFAMVLNYLYRGQFISLDDASYLLKSKFNNWEENPILFTLHSSLTKKDEEAKPPLVDLLSAPFEKNKIVIFSFQRKNRDYTGLAIVRNSDGTFARDNFGNIFYIPQLARSLSNLPGYITNGNTPQGILSLQGIDTSKNIFIGTTPNIQTILPYETDSYKYFHTGYDSTKKWDKYLYNNLLPHSWKNYDPIYEAYYAGKAGRTEIIAHGTTVNPEYYSGKPYYPNTPTLGCLCAKEIWDDEGNRVLSDQYALVQTYRAAGNLNGFLVVVEIDNKNKPITIDEIILQILKSEKLLKERINN